MGSKHATGVKIRHPPMVSSVRIARVAFIRCMQRLCHFVTGGERPTWACGEWLFGYLEQPLRLNQLTIQGSDLTLYGHPAMVVSKIRAQNEKLAMFIKKVKSRFYKKEVQM